MDTQQLYNIIKEHLSKSKKEELALTTILTNIKKYDGFKSLTQVKLRDIIENAEDEDLPKERIKYQKQINKTTVIKNNKQKNKQKKELLDSDEEEKEESKQKSKKKELSDSDEEEKEESKQKSKKKESSKQKKQVKIDKSCINFNTKNIQQGFNLIDDIKHIKNKYKDQLSNEEQIQLAEQLLRFVNNYAETKQVSVNNLKEYFDKDSYIKDNKINNNQIGTYILNISLGLICEYQTPTDKLDTVLQQNVFRLLSICSKGNSNKTNIESIQKEFSKQKIEQQEWDLTEKINSLALSEDLTNSALYIVEEQSI